MNNIFRFKQFAVSHEHCAMKVGTDGVLLGAWAEGGRRVLDVGTGTGLVALMMAQRFAQARITAIDVDEGAARQATINVAASPWSDRIEVVEGTVQRYAQETAEATFDAIVSNPPFFSRLLRCPDEARSTARHNDQLPFGELMAAAARLLTSDGTLSLIMPDDALPLLTAEAAQAGLSLVRVTHVKTTPRKAPKRCLMAFAKRAADAPARHETCELMAADGSRSEWYQELTGEFYL